MNSDLLRQRRNLLLISSILILVQIAGITIERVSILGTVLKVERVEVFSFAMWVIWFYLFLRYYQYLRNEKDLKISKEFRGHIYEYARAYLHRRAGHQGHHPDFEIEEKDILTWWYRQHRAETPEYATPAYLVLWWRLVATVRVAIDTPLATDHLLPIVVGIAPILIWVVENA